MGSLKFHIARASCYNVAMNLEGITLAAVIAELNVKILGAWIQQIHQPLPTLLVFQLYAGEKHQLLIAASSDSRMHLTFQRYENPLSPPAFCMLLRKHLRGGRIKGIHQPSLERIVDLVITSNGQEYTLRAELMGLRSNVILLRGQRILGALKPKVGPRKFLPHALYEPPPSQGKLDPRIMQKEEFLRTLMARSEEGLKGALLRVLEGIGPRTAEELLLRARLTPETPISFLTAEERNALWEAVDNLFSCVARCEFQPCAYLQDGEPVDCTPFPFESLSHLERQNYEGISEALDACHRERHQEPFEQLAHKLAQQLKRSLEKAERALTQVEQDLKNAGQYEQYKELGDLLMANLSVIQKGQSQVEVEDLLQGGKRVIPLDLALNPVANAQRYYERYKKLKRGLERLKARKQELERELNHLQGLQARLEQAKALEELKGLEGELGLGVLKGGVAMPSPSGPRCYPMEGFMILVGRNGRQNDSLIRQARRDDYWLHARDRSGAHVLITSSRRGVVPPEPVLLRAAQLAAYYSRGRTSTKVPVVYTRVKYLRKPKGARPGQVLVTKEEGTLIVEPKEAE